MQIAESLLSNYSAKNDNFLSFPVEFNKMLFYYLKKISKTKNLNFWFMFINYANTIVCV